MTALTLRLLPEQTAICRLALDAEVPEWAWQGAFVSVTRTASELSVVCAASSVPAGIVAEREWRAFVVAGTLDFELTGIVAGLTAPLAQASIPVFVISTYDTDILLVKVRDVEAAVRVLRVAGYVIQDAPEAIIGKGSES